MSGHTPGPWRIRLDWVRNGDIDICAGKSVDVAQVHVRRKPDQTETVPRETGLANARLIVSAPVLLAALKRAIEVLDADGIVYGNCDDEPLDVLSVARAAIAKAEGREP